MITVLIATSQLSEARRERIKAGEASNTASNAVDQAEEAVRQARVALGQASRARNDAQQAAAAADSLLNDIRSLQVALNNSRAAVSEIDANVDRLGELTKAARHELDRLRSASDFSILVHGAESGSAKSYERLRKLAKTESDIQELARRSEAAIREEFLYYTTIPEVWVGGEASINMNGRTGRPQDFSTLDLMQVIQNSAPREARMSVMRTVIRRPSEEIGRAAFKVLQDTDHLPGIAAIGGILRNTFGDKADFLDRPGWLAFLRRDHAN